MRIDLSYETQNIVGAKQHAGNREGTKIRCAEHDKAGEIAGGILFVPAIRVLLDVRTCDKATHGMGHEVDGRFGTKACVDHLKEGVSRASYVASPVVKERTNVPLLV